MKRLAYNIVLRPLLAFLEFLWKARGEIKDLTPHDIHGMQKAIWELRRIRDSLKPTTKPTERE